MSVSAQDQALARQRLLLGHRLHAQRQLIIRQVQQPSAGFPRSVTMRMLLWRPELTLRVAVALARRLQRA
jgi:hypothetical protein